MFTDMVGYSALSNRNEKHAMELLERHRELLRPMFRRHGGTEVKTMGDAFLVEFASALDAVRCAYDIQQSMGEADSPSSKDERPPVRIGIHLGDVVHSQNDVFGDAVNIASRIEPLAEPGGICITQQVYDQIKNKFEHPMTSLGPKELKNLSDRIEVFKVELPRGNGRMTPIDSHRIAVLPFVNMSPDPQDEFFADGLTEELIDRLCQVKGLEVIARTSVMGYKKKDTKAAEIGKELRVGALVEGSVRKAGNKIRVTAQLINANTEGHLWSSKYDRDFQDIFSVQTDIAEQVARALEVRLRPAEREAIGHKKTENVEAYTLYLKGRFYWNERTPESLKRSRQYFEMAISKDPEFVFAYVGLADYYSIMQDQGLMDPKEVSSVAPPLLEKAMKLGAGLAEVHASLANIYMHQWEWSKAETEFMKAIELNPSYATVHHWYSIALALQGREQESLDEIKTALRLDPISPVVSMNLSARIAETGQIEQGIESMRGTLAMEPGFGLAHAHMASLLIGAKRYDEAITELNKALELRGSPTWSMSLMGYAYAMMGDRDRASKILTELEEMANKTYVPVALLGPLYFALGNKQKAIECFERGIEEKSDVIPYIRMFVAYRKMREDPQIGELLNRAVFGKAGGSR